MRTANVHEAKTQLSKLIQAAVDGEEVVIARNGVPAVRLVPVEAKPKLGREGGWLTGQVKVIDPDWWKPDDTLADLFETGDPDHPDPLTWRPDRKR